MKIKIMYPNQYGKLEFTKEELEKLLTDAYDEGYRDGRNSPITSGYAYNSTYTTPSITLCSSSVNAADALAYSTTDAAISVNATEKDAITAIEAGSVFTNNTVLGDAE